MPTKGKSKIKNGRPAKFKTEQELKKACEKYFVACVKAKEVPSKAGLRVALDIDKSVYSDYKKKFPNPIKRSEDLIEKEWVKRLFGVAATGAIFYLKNAFNEDYRDKHETDLTSGGKELGTIVLPATQPAWPAPEKDK